MKQRRTPARFVPFESRRWLSDLALSRQLVGKIQGVKWRFDEGERPWMHWKGVHNVKDPFEITLYPLLLWELKPRTVIEIGSFRGGSALWMADQLQAMGIDSKVYSFDYKPELVRASHPNVVFGRVDCTDLGTFDRDLLKSLPHPWLVIEDAHVNVTGVLKLLDGYLETDDYLIVEDVTWWRGKYRQFKRFMEERGSRYRVDTKYTDMFGYNATFNSNAYLKKI